MEIRKKKNAKDIFYADNLLNTRSILPLMKTYTIKHGSQKTITVSFNSRHEFENEIAKHPEAEAKNAELIERMRERAIKLDNEPNDPENGNARISFEIPM